MDVHEKCESASQVPRRRLAEIRVTNIRITNTRETLMVISYWCNRKLLWIFLIETVRRILNQDVRRQRFSSIRITNIRITDTRETLLVIGYLLNRVIIEFISGYSNGPVHNVTCTLWSNGPRLHRVNVPVSAHYRTRPSAAFHGHLVMNSLKCQDQVMMCVIQANQPHSFHGDI